MPEATAAAAWGAELARWAIPDAVVARAGASPYFFEVGEFATRADEALGRQRHSVSDAMALQALPRGGSVLDVGCGAGAASLPLAERAGLLLAVDESTELLDAFAERAVASGTPFRTFAGRWPEVAGEVPVADVAVCHHVAYNVADLGGFAAALGSHARRRVVLELTSSHPLAWTSPYWRALQDVVRPDGPVAADAEALLRELGLDVRAVSWRQPRQQLDDAAIGRLARRLCLGPDRYADLTAALAEMPPPRWRDLSTLWWDNGGT